MTKADSLRNEIIEKLLCISDKNYLNAINQLVKGNEPPDSQVKLSKEQKLMLDLSEEDIKYKRVISHKDLLKTKMEWLNGK